MNKLIEELLEKEKAREIIKKKQKKYKEKLIDFYEDVNYKSLRKSKCKPREYNVGEYICEYINEYFEEVSLEQIKKDGNFNINKGLIYELEEFDSLKALFLHDSCFFFYKAFMNCLTCYNLKITGQITWNDISAYYAALYLAQSTNCLLGNYAYIINKNDNYFSEKVSKLITGKAKKSYRIDINTNILSNSLEIRISSNSLNTHRWTWEKYNEFVPQKLKINSVYFETNINGIMKNVDHRNKDNYSYEGYIEIQDYNGTVNDFRSQYEVYKQLGNGFDDYPLSILEGWISLYNLYGELKIKHLPLEKEKFKILVKNILNNEDIREKLINVLKDNI